jgi:predicted  nucleic acid-binding Zn-ribbon protein
MNEKPNYPFLFGLVLLAFWAGWYISERGNLARVADLRNTTEQLNNQNRELTNSLDEIQGKLGVYEELVKSQRERLEGLYSDLAGGLEESTSLARGATEDLRYAQGTVERIRELLDRP